MIKKLRDVPGYAFLGIWTIFSLFPLYFMLVSATNTSQDVLASRLLPRSSPSWLVDSHGRSPRGARLTL